MAPEEEVVIGLWAAVEQGRASLCGPGKASLSVATSSTFPHYDHQKTLLNIPDGSHSGRPDPLWTLLRVVTTLSRPTEVTYVVTSVGAAT